MNRRVMPFIIGLLLLLMGCGDSTGPLIATLVVSPATVTLTAIGGTVQFYRRWPGFEWECDCERGICLVVLQPAGGDRGRIQRSGHGGGKRQHYDLRWHPVASWPVGVRYVDCGCTVGGPRDSIGPIQPSHRPTNTPSLISGSGEYR